MEMHRDENTEKLFCCATGSSDFKSKIYKKYEIQKHFPDICERHGIWLHIDAAWGGGLLMSSQYKYKFAGIER